MAIRSPISLAMALATLLTTPAYADSPTEIAPALSGNVEISYEGEIFSSLLREQGLEVGSLVRSSQVTRLDANFGVLPGVQLSIGLPIQVGGGLKYGDELATMQACSDDPNTTQSEACSSGASNGTMIELGRDYNGNPIWVPTAYMDPADIPEYAIRGLQDFKLGTRLAPLSSKPLGRNGGSSIRPTVLATWVIDLALNIPMADNFYSNSTNERGASNGAVGYTIGTAMSQEMENGNPYVSFSYEAHRPFTAYTDAGQAVAYLVDPPDDLKVLVGTELVPYSDGASGGQFTVDMGLGYHLMTQGTWGSGSILPSVLTEGESATSGDPVILDEQTGVMGQMRLNFMAMNHLKIHIGGSLAYYLPSRVEHVYTVRYGRTIGVTYDFAIEGTF